MKKILAVIILGLGLSGCAGMELTSVSVSAGHGHYYPRYSYYTPPVVVYRQPVIVHRHIHTSVCYARGGHSYVAPRVRQRVVVRQPVRVEPQRHDRRDRRQDRKRHRK